jgi:hypothetical protein
MSGMQLGMEIGGPMSAAVGAAAGAIIGGIGSGTAARNYDLKTVRPHLTATMDAFKQGGMDYLSAISDVESLQMEAAKTTSKMGPADGRYYQNTIKPELKEAEGKLTAEQKAGRSEYGMAKASYDVGTDYIPATGINLNHQGERIIPSDQNERITRAIESQGIMPTQSQNSGWSGNLHVHTIDAHGVAQFFDKYKHLMRGSINNSYAENSGGGL